MKNKQEEIIWVPSAKQIKMAELLLNPEDRRSKIDKINEVGISSKTFYEWIKDKNFLDYLKSECDKYTDSELADIWRALIMQCKRGNVNAIKLYFELKGEYSQKVESKNTNTNIDIDLSNLPPEALEEIAKAQGQEEVMRIVGKYRK
jgi:hypothetical protein